VQEPRTRKDRREKEKKERRVEMETTIKDDGRVLVNMTGGAHIAMVRLARCIREVKT
jgi:hypothetical protein